MELNLTTPALLFPAISLLLLAYTNRFLTIATLIRSLHTNYNESPNQIILGQIKNLRRRVYLIKHMQGVGVASLFVCVLCMFLIFAGQIELGKYAFGLSIILLMLSLIISLKEISISVDALELHLKDIESLTTDK
jgi:ABC-type multidrug transport system permease subunit